MTNSTDSPAAPTVSVMMAVYNAEGFLADAIESVLAQTYGDFELVCADDGSDDGSLGILREFAARDRRVRVLERRHSGACATLNACIDAARGRIFAFLDNDDAMHPRTLETAVGAFSGGDMDVLVWDLVQIPEERFADEPFGPLKGSQVRMLDDPIGWGMGDHHVGFWCKAYRREVFRSVRFEPTITYGDLLLYWNIWTTPGIRVGYLSETFLHYRIREGSVMHSAMTEKKAVDFLRALRFIHGYCGDRPVQRRRLQRELFPERAWSAYKISRREPHLRASVLRELRRLFAEGVVRWGDVPLVRRAKMFFAIAAARKEKCP